MNARRLAAENRGASRRGSFDGRDLLHWAVTLDKLSTIIPTTSMPGQASSLKSGAYGNIGSARLAARHLMAARLSWVSHPRLR
jgi:hypothetical protein